MKYEKLMKSKQKTNSGWRFKNKTENKRERARIFDTIFDCETKRVSNLDKYR